MEEVNLSQEEKDKRTKWEEEMLDFYSKEKIRKEQELKVNLSQLENLLDYKTFATFRFGFQEREQFSLDFIHRLIKAFKINNNI
jgi:hypothetical protein